MGNTIGRKVSGHVLIVVLLLSLIVSMIVMLSLETSVLQIKISRNYQSEVLNFMSAEQSLQELENKVLQEAWNLKNSTLKNNIKHAEKLQFVADTLEFGEHQGVVYYQLDVQQKDLEGAQTHLQSVVGIRPDYLETLPVIVQTLPSHAIEKYDITQATRLGYTKGDTSPQVQRLWQRKLPKPVSQAVLVGQPDFPFPDRWPWTKNRHFPPENTMHAEKYSDFSQKHIGRSPIVYQIDGEYHLHAFDLETGKSRIDFDLKSLFSTSFFEEEGEDREALAPELMHADVFYDNQWHSVLVGVVGAKRQALFCLEVTSVLPSAVVENHLNCLWRLEDAHGFFSLPTLSRMADNLWYLILAQAGCSDNNHLSACFKIINFKTGVVSQNLSAISIENKDETSKNRIQFSAMTVIDSKSRGYVDYLYAGDNLGRLWKFDLENQFLQSSGFIKHSLLFSMNDNGVSAGILSQPKIILHPEQGFLISFVAKYSNDTERYLINIWEKDTHLRKETHLFSALKLAAHSNSIETENWYMPIGHAHAYPLVRNKQLLIASEGNQLIAKDMHSSKTYTQANYKQLFSQSVASSSLAFMGAPLVFSQGLKQPSLVLHGLSDGSFAWTELDLNDKIGRCAWRELNH